MKKKDLFRAIVIFNLPVLLLLLFINLPYVSAKLTISPLFLLISSIGFLAAVNLFYFFILTQVKNTLFSIETELDNISKGKLTESNNLKTNQLFRSTELHKKLEAIFNNLKSTISIIEQIAEGKLDHEFNNESDLIEQKLAVLQETLKTDKAELEKSKKEEQQRNWIANGLAKFSDILRQDTHNIQEIGYSIISNLVDYIQFNQGALYVIAEDENEDEYYEIVAAVAYDRQKMMDTKIGIGEGLVGRCAFEKTSVYLTDIPKNYINITSGLGTANPSNLLIVPCMLEDKVFGIIEVASFKTIEKHELEFIEKLGESIASTISTVRNNEKTNALLKASQSQSEELAAQEEELRQNLEEMEAIQEDLKRQMALNSEMQHQLTFEKYLFDTLLNNIPARINFKDKDRKYIRASKSFLERFGKKSNEEIIGKTDVDFFGPEFAKKTMADELEIMQSRKGRINFIEHEIKDNGEEIWKNVSKIPLIDDDGNCLGIFASVYDITESKLLEKQLASEKQLFDTLLNNIPARINFKDKDRKYIRASKSFLERFGKTSNEEILGKTDVDFFGPEFAKKTMADELEIMQSRKGRINFIEHEIKDNGEEIWKNVSKIPLIDDDGNCTGIFASVYDITDYKRAEMENMKLKEELKKLKKK